MQQQERLQLLRRNAPATPQESPLGNGSDGVAVPLPPRRWKTRVLVPAIILSAAAGILIFAARGALRPAAAVRIVPAIVKSEVQGQASTAVVQAPGWVEPDPFPITVSALADGVVREVLVLEGQPVERGQVVARLIDDDAALALRRAEAEVARHEAELATAQAVLTEAQRNWDQPIELQRKLATAAAILAEKQAELERLPAELDAEKARLAEMKDQYERQEQARGVNAEQDLVKAQRAWEAQTAFVQGIEGKRAVLQAQVRAGKAEADAARQALELRIPETRAVQEGQSRVREREAALRNARAILDEAKLRMERMQVRSPADGMVMVRMVQPGSKVMLDSSEMESAQVMRLYDPAKLQVRVDVPLGDAAHVHPGQKAEVVVNVLPDRTFAGQITRVVHEADIQKNTLQVKVAIQDPSAEIKPEMLARVRFLSTPTTQPASEQGAIFVPARLVLKHDSHVMVWLVDQTRGVAEMRVVEPGSARIGDWIEIRSGLRAGDWLIADPPGDLKHGGAVRILGESSETQGGGSAGHSGPGHKENT